MSDLTVLRQSYLDRISTAADGDALEQVRLAALGKKGEISGMMKELGRMTPEERQTRGAALNRLKDEIDAALRARKQGLEDAALDARLKQEWLDVTLPGRPRPQGTIHPISQVTEEVTAIFADMGFRVAEGPQIESDWFNFDALNIPPSIPPGRSMTPSSWPARRTTRARRMCCGPIPRRCRSVPCRPAARRSG